MREVLIWDNFFNHKENFKSSPYFMMNQDLKQNKIHEAKENIKEFINSYLEKKPMCGTNKDSFQKVNYEFSFWHYHCEPYVKNVLEFYNNKKCFDKKRYNLNIKNSCKNCVQLNYKIGRESSHVIYYLKFNDSDTIGIVAYATKHIPFPKLTEDTIQAVMRAKIEHFNSFKI